MLDKNTFQKDPRDYAVELVTECQVSEEEMIEILLSYMSHEDIREALDKNEVSPRFINGEDEEPVNEPSFKITELVSYE